MVVGVNPKVAIKKILDFCNEYFVTDTANTVVSGRVSAVNYACLHGNFDILSFSV